MVPDPVDSPAMDERRAQTDRRTRPTPMFSRYLLRGRRRGGRRDGEVENVYVDRPGRWAVAAFAVVVGLSLMDAYFTLTLLRSGQATEANPLMRAVLALGDRPFVVIKTLITIVAVAFLCLHRTWRLGQICLTVALLGYSGILLYHLYAQRILAQQGGS